MKSAAVLEDDVVSEGKQKQNFRNRSSSADFDEQHINDDSFRILSVNNKSFVV